MVPYVDSNGVMWSIDPPGTLLTRDGDNGEPIEEHSEMWSAHIVVDAYEHPAGRTLVVATDQGMLKDAIESYVTSPLRKPVQHSDAPAADKSWALFLLICAGLYYYDRKKGR